MDNEFRIELSAGISEKSKQEISNQINDIKEKVKDLEINFKIDPKAANNLVGQLDTLKVSLTDVNLSQKTLNTLVSQINTALKSVDFSSIANNGQVGKAGQQIGQQLGNGISQGLNNNISVLDRFKESLKNIGMGSEEIDVIANRLDSLGIKIETLNQSKLFQTTKNGSKEVLSVDISGLDKLGQAVKLTEQYNIKNGSLIKSIDAVSSATQKAGNAADTFLDKQKNAISKAENNLSTILSKLNDPGATKTLAGTDFNANGLNEQIGRVRAAIENLGNSTKSTFTDSKNAVDTEITALNNLISTLKNAQYAATSLRTKDLDTVKNQYSSKLDVLVTKMQSSGIYTNGFQNGANNLRTILNNATDTSGLIAFLNGLDKLEAGYKKAEASAKAFNKSQKVGIDVSSLQSKIADLQRISPEIDNFKTSINGADVTVQSLLQDLSKVNTSSDLGVVKKNFNAFKDAAKAAGITVTEAVAKTKSITEQSKNIQLNIETGSYEAKIESLVSRTRQWIDENGNARISTENLSKALKDLNTANSELAKSGGNTIANQEKLIEAEQKLDTELNKVRNEITKTNAELAKTSAVDNLKQKVQQFYDINTKSHLKYGSQLKQIMSELGQGAEVPITKLKELEKRFIDIQNVARVTGRLGKSFFDQIKSGIQSFIPWLSTTHLVMRGIHSIREGISTVKELDYALVDLRKTTKMSTSQLEDFYYASNEVAKQMGVTTQQILEQSSAWSRLGFNTAEQATKMAKYSSMFATISPGMDIDSATDGLVSVMKAFKIGAEDVDDVVDGIMSKINIIGNTRAVNNTDIVNFLTKSSAAMAEANNTLEDTIALGTAITEITRDAANAGQVMKTVSMRIRGYDEQTEEYIGGVEELSGKIADLTKTASRPGGISLFTDETKQTYKSTRELFDDIAEIYQDLTDKQQAGLLEALAGKRNGQAVAAILNNYDAVRDSLESMYNSAGSAEAEMSIVMDSITYKANALKETWTGVAQNLFKREDMKSVIDFLTSFASGVDKLTDKLGLFGTIGAGIGLGALIKNIGRRKMQSLNICFEIADNNKCSLEY